MYCRKCGKEILNNKEYCEACQIELDNNTLQSQQQHESNRSQRKKCCPKCKSRNLQITTNTEFHSETKGGGVSASKGCCGYMMLGPLGLLCGACGSKSKTTVTSTSTNVWVCRDCGNKFRDIADIDMDIKNRKNNKKIIPAMFYCLGVFIALPEVITFLALVSMPYPDPKMAFSMFLFILIGVAMIIAGKFSSTNIGKAIEGLEEEKKYIEENGFIDE